MAVKGELDKRMKESYENVANTKLLKRTPVAIRIDGKSFHTFTRGFRRPFDAVFMGAMQQTMKYLCENIQGCVLGYTQSDEITLILADYKDLNTAAWFDYRVQKMCSVAASMATMKFNRVFAEILLDINPIFNFDDDEDYIEILKTYGFDTELLYGEKRSEEYVEGFKNMIEFYYKANERGAMFDARCFNIPKEEVTNLIYWRQLDASRNSVQMVGQCYFSSKQLHKKSCSNIQDMLMEQHGINWNNFPTACKRGTCCIKKQTEDGESNWVIDKEIPIFKGDGRQYIESLIYFEDLSAK